MQSGSETARIMAELGLLGFIFIYTIRIYVVLIAMRFARRR